MDKSSANPTPAFKPTPEKKEGDQARKNDFNYRSVIGLLRFLTNSTHPEDKFAVHKCARFSVYPKLTQDQAVECVLKYLKGTDMKGLIMKPGA